MVSAEDREVIARYLGEFGLELGDRANPKSTLTWACNVYARSGLTLAVFTQRLYSARSRTKATTNIRTARFGYFKALVIDECSLREPPPEIAQAAREQQAIDTKPAAPASSQPRKSLAGKYSHLVRR